MPCRIAWPMPGSIPVALRRLIEFLAVFAESFFEATEVTVSAP